jgi:hypothetical protein
MRIRITRALAIRVIGNVFLPILCVVGNKLFHETSCFVQYVAFNQVLVPGRRNKIM